MKRIFALLFTLMFASISTYSIADSTIPFQNDYHAIAEKAKSLFLIEGVGEDNNVVKTGSGFVTASNMFITNHHVIENTAALVIYSDNYAYSFMVTDLLAVDKDADIAILSFPEGVNFTSLEFDPEYELLRGMPVVAIGSPEGMINSVSNGNISSIITYKNGFKELQFTAPISHGSSGGALFNENGKIIGLVYAKHASGENMNYAVHTQHVLDLINTVNPNESVKLYEYNNLDYLEPPVFVEGTLDSELNVPVLYWANDPNATSYRIYRLGSSGTYGMIGEVPSTKFERVKSFIDYNPPHGNTASYYICATNKKTISRPSITVEIKVP